MLIQRACVLFFTCMCVHAPVCAQLFTAVDLPNEAIYCYWSGFVVFILFSCWIVYDRDRYKKKHQDNHNILLLCTVICVVAYMSQAQGHGRMHRHVIGDVKPYNLIRCVRVGGFVCVRVRVCMRVCLRV